MNRTHTKPLMAFSILASLLLPACGGESSDGTTSTANQATPTAGQNPTQTRENPDLTPMPTLIPATLNQGTEVPATASPPLNTVSTETKGPETPSPEPQQSEATASPDSSTATPTAVDTPVSTPAPTQVPSTEAPQWTPPRAYTLGDALETLHFMNPVNAINDAANGTPRPPQPDDEQKASPAGHEVTATPDDPDSPGDGGDPDNPSLPDEEPPPVAFEFVEVIIEGDIVYLGGQGGLFSADISNSNNPIYTDHRGDMPKVYSLSADNGQLWAGTHNEVYGFNIDESGTLQNSFRRDPGPNGNYLGKIDHRGDILYLPMRQGGFATQDISEAGLETEFASILGTTALGELEDAAAVVVEGDFAYIADGSGGLKIIDVSDPTSLSVVGQVDSPGIAQDIVVGDGTAYLALGSAGIAAIDIQDPSQPLLLDVYDTAGTAFGLDYAYNHLFVASWSWVEVFEVTDPANPRLAALEPPTQSAFDVAVSEDFIASADWYVATWYRFDATKIGPELHYQDGIVRFNYGEPGETVVEAITVHNKGDVDLVVERAETDNPGIYSVDSSGFTIEPGKFKTLEVSMVVPEGASNIYGNLRLWSNDPDEPYSGLSLQYATNGVSVGEEAPDFILESMEGDLVSLSEQKGYVVLLAYFATW